MGAPAARRSFFEQTNQESMREMESLLKSPRVRLVWYASPTPWYKYWSEFVSTAHIVSYWGHGDSE